jgi:hypothetical protein
LLLTVILGALLMVMFCQSFQPDLILFVNDSTIGQMKAAPNHLPGAFTGVWRYGFWVGDEGVATAPTISAILTMVLTPEIFLKVYAPLTMLFAGLCAWVFFRQLEFNPAVCLLGGVAAGLNMHFFSIACWGTGSWNIAAGMVFLALAALCSKSIPQLWARGILAGLALGMNLMEGFDVGAILCIYVGLFIVWQIFVSETPGAGKVITAFCTEALVIFFSALLAAHSISTLVGTQVAGVTGTGQDAETKEQRWNPATQWSLPKLETLRVVVPGLFGYRMSGRITVPDKSSAYWGTVGQDPRIDTIRHGNPGQRTAAIDTMDLPKPLRDDLQSNDLQTREKGEYDLMHRAPTVGRYSGSGEYAGVLVSLLALFGLLNAWPGPKSPYSRGERRSVWFWGAAAFLSLLAAWGRHAFFYRLLYQLPYVSTIRNPIKFMHPFHLAWLILAAYGLEALWRRYLRTAPPRTDILSLHLQKWWSRVSGFEKGWAAASLALVGASLAAVFIFSAWKPHLIQYLEENGFTVSRAAQMADFSVVEARWFAFWLFVSAGAVVCIMSGAWSGRQARQAWIFLGAIIVLDLARSDVPWIHYFNYKQEYTANSVVDLLQDKPYEHRVTGRLSPRGLGSGIGTQLGKVYDYWEQNEFPNYKIQAVDFAQWPRVPLMDAAYMRNFALHGDDVFHTDMWPCERLWQLTNTRYILTSGFVLPLLERAVSNSHFVLQSRSYLKVIQKPQVTALEDAGDMTVVPDADGTFVLIDFTNTLPRAKLYSAWQSPTNDEATLKTLASHDFDPEQTVLVAQNTPVGQPPGDPKADAGSVSITDYQPKYVQLQASAATPAVLLLNDHIAPAWRVWVDKKPAPLLRCNYLMRGVYLTPGEHTVEFRFRPPQTPLYVSLCAWGVGILTSSYLICSRAPPPAPVPPPTPNPPQKPAAAPQPETAGRAKPKRRR